MFEARCLTCDVLSRALPGAGCSEEGAGCAEEGVGGGQCQANSHTTLGQERMSRTLAEALRHELLVPSSGEGGVASQVQTSCEVFQGHAGVSFWVWQGGL